MHACVHTKSRVQLLATLWTIAHHAPLSMGFSRQEYWGGLPLPPLDPGTGPRSLKSQADFLPLEPLGNPWFCFEV